MATAPLRVSEQPWKIYQEIEHVIATRYGLSERKNSWHHSKISQALQRLGEAVVMRYNLSEEPLLNWSLKLEKDSIKQLSLTSTEKMLNARILTWEEAIEPTPAHEFMSDSWTEGDPGRTAAFRPQPSIQQVLRDIYSTNYSELKLILTTTPDQAWEIFKRVEGVVQKEIRRLAELSAAHGYSRDKETEIAHAVDHLRQAVLHKYSLPAPAGHEALPKIDTEQIDSTDLYSIRTMLDLKCSVWKSGTRSRCASGEGFEPGKSVRQALNLATGNPLSMLFGLQPPLWGKTTALLNVESALA